MTTPGYFIVKPRADVAIDPFHFGIFVGEAALRDEVEQFADQFWTVIVLNLRALSATSSTTALCNVAVLNFGAVQPSM